MNVPLKVGLHPRRLPVQARSRATVETIFEATIQVLREGGAARLTTTRVADRAGVSVGSMYQYFPSKDALLCAVLQRHMDAITSALEDVSKRHRGRGVATIARELITAFVNAKAARLEETQALYLVAASLESAPIFRNVSARMETAVADLLASASDATIHDAVGASFILVNAIAGATRALIERGPKAESLEVLRHELTLMAEGYLSQKFVSTSQGFGGPVAEEP